MMTPATKQCSICNEQFANDRDLRHHNRSCKIAPLQKAKPGGAKRKVDASKGNKDRKTANTEKTSKNAFVSSTVQNSRIDKSQEASDPIQITAPILGSQKMKRIRSRSLMTVTPHLRTIILIVIQMHYHR